MNSKKKKQQFSWLETFLKRNYVVFEISETMFCLKKGKPYLQSLIFSSTTMTSLSLLLLLHFLTENKLIKNEKLSFFLFFKGKLSLVMTRENVLKFTDASSI